MPDLQEDYPGALASHTLLTPHAVPPVTASIPDGENKNRKTSRESESVMASAPLIQVVPADETSADPAVRDGLNISQSEPAERAAPTPQQYSITPPSPTPPHLSLLLHYLSNFPMKTHSLQEKHSA